MEAFLFDHPYLFPAAFVFMWVAISSTLSRLSGWTHLSSYYCADGEFDGAKRRFQSASIGQGGMMDVNYSNCLTFVVNGRKLRLSILLPFRFAHPSLDIPLSELSAEPKEFLVFKYLRLFASNAPEIKISVSEGQARWIEENSSGGWSMPKPLEQ